MLHWLYAGVYTGLGLWLGQRIDPAIETLQKLYQTFHKQQCVNTILPKNLESYVPSSVINTLEMGKFICEQLWIQLEQSLCQTCVKTITQTGTYYHLRCMIDNKMYSVILKPERGPDSECTYENENGGICTERVKAYLRGTKGVIQRITPEHLGYNSITKRLEGVESSLGMWSAKETLNY